MSHNTLATFSPATPNCTGQGTRWVKNTVNKKNLLGEYCQRAEITFDALAQHESNQLQVICLVFTCSLAGPAWGIRLTDLRYYQTCGVQLPTSAPLPNHTRAAHRQTPDGELLARFLGITATAGTRFPAFGFANRLSRMRLFRPRRGRVRPRLDSSCPAALSPYLAGGKRAHRSADEWRQSPLK